MTLTIIRVTALTISLLLFALALVLFVQGYYVIPLTLIAIGMGTAVAVTERDEHQ